MHKTKIIYISSSNEFISLEGFRQIEFTKHSSGKLALTVSLRIRGEVSSLSLDHIVPVNDLSFLRRLSKSFGKFLSGDKVLWDVQKEATRLMKR